MDFNANGPQDDEDDEGDSNAAAADDDDGFDYEAHDAAEERFFRSRYGDTLSRVEEAAEPIDNDNSFDDVCQVPFWRDFCGQDVQGLQDGKTLDPVRINAALAES